MSVVVAVTSTGRDGEAAEHCGGIKVRPWVQGGDKESKGLLTHGVWASQDRGEGERRWDVKVRDGTRRRGRARTKG